MEQDKPKMKIVIDLDAAAKMYVRLADVHRFGNWDKGKGRPPEYIGRDVSEELLRSAADATAAASASALKPAAASRSDGQYPQQNHNIRDCG